jgi:hypothetical protein
MPRLTIAAKIDDLQKFCRFADEDRIKQYLTAHPELVDLLLEARPHIELQFGRGTVVELRFPRDYEGDYQGELLAMIQSHLDADDALDRFDKLWDEWWGDASGRCESWPLYVGIEYTGERVY